jgi:mannose-1-phosphate guanylyltransferase
VEKDGEGRARAETYLVVLAGGAGTRFWPASRAARPKQLLPLGGSGGESLLAATVRRLAPLVPRERVYVSTGAHLVDATARELDGVPRAHFLAEPVARNTAPCIAWATAVIAARDPEALVGVVPSDHHVANEPAFRATVAAAFASAAAGRLTTIGIVPARAETGYGYVERGAEIAPGCFAVERFVEKPERAAAEAFVAGGKHLWNAGMFFFRARDMLAAIDKHLPSVGEAARAIAGGEDAASRFPGMPAVSIDHGVMQPASTADRTLAVVPGDFGWSDLGSWASAWELAAKDDRGNALPERSVTADASGNLVCDLAGGNRTFALLGVRDLVLVETPDAVLVLPRDRAQDVRQIIDLLKARGRGDLL